MGTLSFILSPARLRQGPEALTALQLSDKSFPQAQTKLLISEIICLAHFLWCRALAEGLWLHQQTRKWDDLGALQIARTCAE